MTRWQEIDAKWQRAWEENKVFEAEPNSEPKFYLTVAYPYVSGPMHVGHARTYTVPDVVARYKRMRGFNVLFPMAYHFTGTPLVGAAKRVEQREPEFVKVLIERYGVREDELSKFEDPHYFATYFVRESDLSYRKGMHLLGYSIDWRREFTTVDKTYSKFIAWQYHKLMDANLVSKGAHPVKWCPGCQNPVTDHDLLEGEGVSIVEYTLLKYRLGDLILPAATLRPETVFGVTNLWLNPKVEYVLAEVDGECWVVSEQAVEKLRNQGFEVGKVIKFEERLIGKEVEVPVTHERVSILPAEFVDPESASGVVGSVPSHAPYDYMALLELQRNPERLSPYAVDLGEVRKIKPISLIELPGFGESPAIDVVKAKGISEQSDPKLEDATSEVYRGEFAKGVMRDWVPDYAGMRVSEAKERVHEALLKSGEGAVMYELSEKPVICRCGTKCIVKVVEDQWFLNYSDPAWKDKARECLAKMRLVPDVTRAQFEHTIGWLLEWPCTRRVGMGTPAPWDPSWIIESLSDSTIYMIYYTIAHIIRDLDADKLTDEVFDYVLLGKGDAASLAEASGIERATLEGMRREVEYWYPLDYRMSANELIPNHLTFHIFHHVAIFPPESWPRGIVSFGMAMLEGKKMSSSRGNIIAINEAVRKYGADVVRLYLMSAVEPWQDFDWRVREADAMVKHLERFYGQAREIIALPQVERPELTSPDRWMLSRLQGHLQATTDALESFETREAVQHAFFLMMHDLRRYLKRAKQGEPRAWVLEHVLDVWLRMLAPFAPHVCEELWHQAGKESFISTTRWPEAEEEFIDKVSELAEEYLSSVGEDVGKILRVTKIERPERICLYVAEDWKWRGYRKALEQVRKGKADIGELIRASREELKKSPGELAEFFKRTIKELRGISQEQLEALAGAEVDELQILIGAVEFLREQFGVEEVKVFKADDPKKHDPKGRAKLAVPLKPAIYVE
ncbi:MAG: leucine--tRNA ligase [Candidatus Hadarchaeota archaeon]|nr:leucine--tRNA ligase [Candidatus Hadarchaeota archaeon]